MAKKRRDARFDTMARVEAPEITTLSGKLVDISLRGCKVLFPVPVAVDLENDYTLKIRPSENLSESELVLLCVPAWTCEDSGSTEIGMKILRSPDTARLAEYVKQLHLDNSSKDDIKSMIVDSVCQFV